MVVGSGLPDDFFGRVPGPPSHGVMPGRGPAIRSYSAAKAGTQGLQRGIRCYPRAGFPFLNPVCGQKNGQRNGVQT